MGQVRQKVGQVRLNVLRPIITVHGVDFRTEWLGPIEVELKAHALHNLGLQHFGNFVGLVLRSIASRSQCLNLHYLSFIGSFLLGFVGFEGWP